jgi:hypothetical protein
MTTHAAYDVYFDKLCDLLINRDKFDTDVLEDNDFAKRIIEIKLYLKGVRHDFVRDSSKRKVLLQLFASGDEVEDFWELSIMSFWTYGMQPFQTDFYLTVSVIQVLPRVYRGTLFWRHLLKLSANNVSPLDPKDLSCQYHSLLPNQVFTHLVPLLSNPGSYIQRPHLQLIPPPHKYNKLSLISSKGVDRVLLCHVPPFQVHSLPWTSLSFQPRNPNGLPQLSKRFTT